MESYITNIEEATIRNDLFRKVLFTAKHSQLVIMSLKPGEDIGAETHQLDQFIRVEAGRGLARLNGVEYSAWKMDRGRHPGRDRTQYREFRARGPEAVHDLQPTGT